MRTSFHTIKYLEYACATDAWHKIAIPPNPTNILQKGEGGEACSYALERWKRWYLPAIYITERSLTVYGMLDFVEDDFVGVKSH